MEFLRAFFVIAGLITAVLTAFALFCWVATKSFIAAMVIGIVFVSAFLAFVSSVGTEE